MEPAERSLRNLVARHCGALHASARRLADLVAQMEMPEDHPGRRAQDARDFARHIAEASAPIGLRHVGAIARDIEHALEPIVAVNGAPTPAQSNRLARLLADLVRATASLTPETSGPFGLDRPAVKHAHPPARPAAPTRN